MRMMIHVVAVFALTAASPTFGQALDFDRLDTVCRNTAKVRPAAVAKMIARQAVLEHRRFGGQEIDASGQIVQLAPVPAGEGGSGAVAPEGPTRNVLRYWEILFSTLADQSNASAAQGAPNPPGRTSGEPHQSLDHRFIDLAALLSTLQKADISANGVDPTGGSASIMDVPWSAAFVSAVLKGAGIRSERFAFSSTHIDYITQAVSVASLERDGTARSTLYRACDPYKVRPRPGDLLCYHRHEGVSDARLSLQGSPLFRSLIQDIAEGKEPIQWSHCDIVTSVDERAQKVRAVGGNVQQAVTVRSLNLGQKGVLSENQGGRSCYAPGNDQGPCSLNARPWFVLLQIRGR